MTMLQCPKGHLFDDRGGVAGCPTCANEEAELSKTRPFYDPMPTQAYQDGTKTTPLYAHLDCKAEPVVGWLVCVHGQDKGQDFRLVAGRNRVGRGSAHAVSLSDPSVSASAHAELVFDPASKNYLLAPGEKGLAYLNGELTLTPSLVKANDRITVGKSELLFVPIGSDSCDWLA
jgi:hypothetical protein